jgi:hypothetical protein
MNLFNVILGAVFLFVGFSLLFSIPTMLLWDWLMPQLFGLKEITLFQAWGLSLLCSLLFKSHTSSK